MPPVETYRVVAIFSGLFEFENELSTASSALQVFLKICLTFIKLLFSANHPPHAVIHLPPLEEDKRTRKQVQCNTLYHVRVHTLKHTANQTFRRLGASRMQVWYLWIHRDRNANMPRTKFRLSTIVSSKRLAARLIEYF